MPEISKNKRRKIAEETITLFVTSENQKYSGLLQSQKISNPQILQIDSDSYRTELEKLKQTYQPIHLEVIGCIREQDYYELISSTIEYNIHKHIIEIKLSDYATPNKITIIKKFLDIYENLKIFEFSSISSDTKKILSEEEIKNKFKEYNNDFTLKINLQSEKKPIDTAFYHTKPMRASPKYLPSSYKTTISELNIQSLNIQSSLSPQLPSLPLTHEPSSSPLYPEQPLPLSIKFLQKEYKKYRESLKEAQEQAQLQFQQHLYQAAAKNPYEKQIHQWQLQQFQQRQQIQSEQQQSQQKYLQQLQQEKQRRQQLQQEYLQQQIDIQPTQSRGCNIHN